MTALTVATCAGRPHSVGTGRFKTHFTGRLSLPWARGRSIEHTGPPLAKSTKIPAPHRPTDPAHAATNRRISPAPNRSSAVRSGAAILIADADFTADRVRSDIVPLLADESRRAAMTAAAASVGTRNGTENVIALIDMALGR